MPSQASEPGGVHGGLVASDSVITDTIANMVMKQSTNFMIVASVLTKRSSTTGKSCYEDVVYQQSIYT